MSANSRKLEGEGAELEEEGMRYKREEDAQDGLLWSEKHTTHQQCNRFGLFVLLWSLTWPQETFKARRAALVSRQEHGKCFVLSHFPGSGCPSEGLPSDCQGLGIHRSTAQSTCQF